MDLGLGADDFAWIKQIITEEHVETFWLENSNKEGERLKLAAEERYLRTKRENMELFGVAQGRDSKWRRYRHLTLEIFYTFWSAKLAVKLFGWNIEALFKKRSFSNQTRKGQALFGWTREHYTMYNHVLRCHSPEDKKANFEKPKMEQNQFFGIEPAFQNLIGILNSIRFPSRHLSFDEELIYMRGRSPVIQYVKDKRNRYGAKLFMLCGSNEGSSHRGYLHYGRFYRGKERERPTSFSGYGKGYETVMNAIVAMKLRYMGYWIMTDSWFSGLNLFLHAKIWGVNMAGTIVPNRKGLEHGRTDKLKKTTLFGDLKKKLKVKYNPEKKKGYLRGHWEPRSAPNHDLVVAAVKDSKVFLEVTNSIGSHEFDFFRRWSKDDRKYVRYVGWKVHSLFCKHYGSGDSGTMWRCQGNGHKYITNRWWQGLRDYMLWGFPIVCAYLNMKMSNPEDKRPIWMYKHALVSYSQTHAPALRLRKCNTSVIISEDEHDYKQSNRRREKRNPYKCELGRKKSIEARLKAAEYCEQTMGRRMIAISDHFGVRNKQLRCARCRDKTSWCCVSCGVALCLATTTSSRNHSPVSCMDVCHQRWKYNLDGSIKRDI